MLLLAYLKGLTNETVRLSPVFLARHKTITHRPKPSASLRPVGRSAAWKGYHFYLLVLLRGSRGPSTVTLMAFA